MRSPTEDDFLDELGDGDGTTRQTTQSQNRLLRLFWKLFQTRQQPMMMNDHIPLNIHIPEPHQSSRSSCFTCGCCGFTFSLLFVLVSLASLITVYSMWAHVIALSTTITGLGVRGLGLQGHYTFTGFLDSSSQSISQSSIVVSSSSTTTSSTNSSNPKVALLHGWFDLHSQRTDWNVVLFQDTFGLFLSPNPSGRFYLWAKRFNETTQTLEHTVGSPWVLDSVRVGSKTGNDLPEFLKQGIDDNHPLFYSFVIHSSRTTWSVPLSK
jgi:hypothetical protein